MHLHLPKGSINSYFEISSWSLCVYNNIEMEPRVAAKIFRQETDFYWCIQCQQPYLHELANTVKFSTWRVGSKSDIFWWTGVYTIRSTTHVIKEKITSHIRKNQTSQSVTDDNEKHVPKELYTFAAGYW